MRAQYLPILVLCAISFSCRSRIDIEGERASLLETDSNLAEISLSSNNVDDLVAFYADDAKVIPPKNRVLNGLPEIREFLRFTIEKPEYSVTWTPENVTVSPDARTGHTFGTIRFAGPGLGAPPVITNGRYVSVWRKEDGGSWKCVVNIWNLGPKVGKLSNATPR